MDQKRMNASEQSAHLEIIACVAALRRVSRNLTRLNDIKRGKFWLNGAITSLQNLSNALDATIPDGQHESLRRQIHNLRFHVGVTSIANQYNADYGRWLSFNQLDIVGDALKNVCMMCTKNTQEQRQCPYAKLMDSLPIDKPDDHSNGCGYFGL